MTSLFKSTPASTKKSELRAGSKKMLEELSSIDTATLSIDPDDDIESLEELSIPDISEMSVDPDDDNKRSDDFIIPVVRKEPRIIKDPVSRVYSDDKAVLKELSQMNMEAMAYESGVKDDESDKDTLQDIFGKFIEPEQNRKEDIKEAAEYCSPENIAQAIRNGQEDNEDDVTEKLLEMYNLCQLDNSSESNVLAAISPEHIEAQKRNLMRQAAQAVEDATPYVLGKQVMEMNQLCYLDTVGFDSYLSIYNGKYWEYLCDNDLKQLAYDSLPETMKFTTKGIETLITNVANFVKREIKKQYNEGKKRFSEKDYADIENHIVFQNCVYDVLTGKKRDFSSKKPYYYAIQTKYIEEDVDTPYYDKFKRDATGGDEASMKMFDYMQAYLAMPNRKGKCFFIMTYARDSGKTTFGEFIERYYETNRVVKMDTEHLGGKFSYAGFDRALLISCLEMPVSRLSVSAAKALKNFTGESRIEIEAKYQNHITAQVRFKTLLASNGGLYLPAGEMDEAFYRRAIVIPFVHSTPLDSLIADLPQKWDEERSAIISKCVRSFRRILAKDGGIVFPESELSKEIKAQWTGKSLINERFVMEAIQFTACPEDAIPKKDLKLVYDKYYADNIWGSGTDRPLPCTKDQIVSIVREIYPQSQTSKLRRCTIENPEHTSNEHCITGVKWSKEAEMIISKMQLKETE